MEEQSQVRLLFVDDEPMVLQMLRLTTASLRQKCEAVFAKSGEEALALFQQKPFDVVVSDMRMPGISGAQLLNQVLQLQPATFRVILTGYVEHDEVMKCVGSTHQFLYKPFDLNQLREVLSRALNLNQRLRSPPIRALVAKLGCLPSIPDIYFRILEALQSPDCPVERIAEIVATDPGFTAKLLQLVNSAFFGFARQTSNAQEAVMLLGTSRIRALALTYHVFSAFSLPPQELFAVESVWTHSWRVAQLAERIARGEKANEVGAEQAFSAGLLHDVGKLLLANEPSLRYGELVNAAVASDQALIQAEREVFQVDHAELGACLLSLWGLPTALIEAVLWHHEPSQSPPGPFSPLTAVHAANALVQEGDPSLPSCVTGKLDAQYLERSEAASHLDSWRREVAKL